ncbi:MAG: sulfatase-like hydrolase/transferase [Planctomycetes bacterium]|nr:sulfatase-like hydrolase/transferase [Planctomycetota bacterium]
MDATRFDRLGCYGGPKDNSPTVDELAGAGTRFATAIAQRGATWPSLTSIMTGKYPVTHGVRINGRLPDAEDRFLYEYLHDAGYATSAFLSNYGDAAPDRGLDVKQRTDMPPKAHYVWDGAATKGAVEWIGKSHDKPFFCWVHLMDPHSPYDPPPKYRDRYENKPSGWMGSSVTLSRLRQAVVDKRVPFTEQELDQYLDTGFWHDHEDKKGVTYRTAINGSKDWIDFDLQLDLAMILSVDLTPEETAYVHSRYDAQIRGVDDDVKTILDELASLGVADNTLVVFFADHGEELYEHGHYFFHACSPTEGVTRIPLVFRWPGRIPAGKVVDDLIEEIDVLPTLLDLLDLPRPSVVEGESLLPFFDGHGSRKNKHAYMELFQGVSPTAGALPPADGIYSVRDQRWKFTLNLGKWYPRMDVFAPANSRGYPIDAAELYDLTNDPGEAHNLLDASTWTSLSLPSDGNGVASPREQAAYLLDAFAAWQDLLARLHDWGAKHRNAKAARFKPTKPMDDGMAARLAALGYIEGSPVQGEAHGADDVREQFLGEIRRLATQAVADGHDADVLSLLLQAEAQGLSGDRRAAAATVKKARSVATPADAKVLETRLRRIPREE